MSLVEVIGSERIVQEKVHRKSFFKEFLQLYYFENCKFILDCIYTLEQGCATSVPQATTRLFIVDSANTTNFFSSCIKILKFVFKMALTLPLLQHVSLKNYLNMNFLNL